MTNSKFPRKLAQSMTYQNELLQAIFNDLVPSGPVGLSVYQHNLHMTAQRSLSVTFPVIATMLGEEAVYILGHRLLREELPATGDWADWGQGIMSVLQASELHAAHPYLKDMAAFEWAFHSASRHCHQSSDVHSLHCLKTHDPDSIHLQLQSSLQLVCSRYPLYGLWQAHRKSSTGEIPEKAELEKIMATEESDCYVISKGANRTQVKGVNSQEFEWLDGVRQGMSVGALLEAYPTLDFVAWLSVMLQEGWLVRLTVVDSL